MLGIFISFTYICRFTLVFQYYGVFLVFSFWEKRKRLLVEKDEEENYSMQVKFCYLNILVFEVPSARYFLK